MSTAKIQDKGQVTIPTAVRRQAGLSKGFAVKGSKIVITPKIVIDRSQFPNAYNEYTPAQRRVIDAQLAKADADVKAGRVSRTFDTAEEFIADLHKASAKLSAKKTTKRAGR